MEEKSKYVYLDWNTMKSIKNNKKLEFTAIIDILKINFKVPYSYAHLCDLQKKFSNDTKELVKNDLEFIDKLTNGDMLGMYEDDWIISKQNIFERINEVSKFNTLNYEAITKEKRDEIRKIGLGTYIKDEHEKEFIPLIKSILDRFNSTPELYSQFREIFNQENSEKDLQHFNRLRKKINQKDLKEIVLQELKLNGNAKPCISEQICTAYRLLEFNPQYKEKVTEKSSFSNIYNDGQHMKFASNAKYYITNDKKSKKKIEFIYNTYDIKTEVCTVDEFIENYIIQDAKM
ncbi:hypothetical protein [Clostridium sp. ZS1]|uniref:hypothetical protein n=1 Tax=Clostridium sp. ZS1 TaxID=2949989 RepID=UPI001DB51840|nr:hypothetical protein [Clostridium sp. ZS1]MBN1067589.1 hypothetical protein [Clostridium botulinum]